MHRDARHVRAGRQLPVRRRRGGRDRGVIHRDLGTDPVAGAAGLLRALRVASPRAARGARGPAADLRRVCRVGALDGLDAEASRRVRGGGDRRAADPRDPVPLDAAGLVGRRQRSGQHDHAQGLRPARRGIWSGLQRAAPARRRGRFATAEGGVPARPAGGGQDPRDRGRCAASLHPRRGRKARRGDRRPIPQGISAGQVHG